MSEVLEVLSSWTNTNYPGEIMKIVRHSEYDICLMNDRNGVIAMKLESWIEYENMLHATGWVKQYVKTTN